MNGISLMIALAAIGIDVDWEAGPDGQQHYTIRAEQVLMGPLRQGKAIVTGVTAENRNLRRFQVVLGDKPIRYDAITQSVENMVKFGWRPSEDGGLDFMIQLSPERLETLAQGVPIVGRVDPQVTDIRRIYIFKGVDPLPKELPKSTTTRPDPPQYLRGEAGLKAASAQIEDSSLSAPQGSSRSADSSRSVNQREGNYASSPRVSEQSNRYPEDSTDWRHNEQAQPRSRGFESGERYSPAREESVTAGDSYNVRDARQRYSTEDRERAYSEARFAERNPEYDRRDPVNYPRASPGAQQQQAYRDGSTLPRAGYNPALAASAASNPSLTPPGSQPISAPVVTTNWQQGTPTAQVPGANLPTAGVPATLVQLAAESSAPEVRPWTPLILTTLSLFASLGANAYLGWLAWSFFWRYRDAASDVARARVASRQAA